MVLVMVSAMMLAAPGSSVTGMKGRQEAAAAEGVTADDGVMASSEDATYRTGKKTTLDIYIHLIMTVYEPPQNKTPTQNQLEQTTDQKTSRHNRSDHTNLQKHHFSIRILFLRKTQLKPY